MRTRQRHIGAEASGCGVGVTTGTFTSALVTTVGMPSEVK